MKKIAILGVGALLLLSACNGKETSGESGASKASAGTVSTEQVKPGAPLEVEAVKHPTGDLQKDAFDLFMVIKDSNFDKDGKKTSDTKKIAEAQKTMDVFVAYYKEKGKDKEFMQELTKVTTEQAMKDKAAKEAKAGKK